MLAQHLQEEGPNELKKLTVGQLCHLIQLSVGIGLLGYENCCLKPIIACSGLCSAEWTRMELSVRMSSPQHGNLTESDDNNHSAVISPSLVASCGSCSPSLLSSNAELTASKSESDAPLATELEEVKSQLDKLLKSFGPAGICMSQLRQVYSNAYNFASLPFVKFGFTKLITFLNEMLSDVCIVENQGKFRCIVKSSCYATATDKTSDANKSDNQESPKSPSNTRHLQVPNVPRSSTATSSSPAPSRFAPQMTISPGVPMSPELRDVILQSIKESAYVPANSALKLPLHVWRHRFTADRQLIESTSGIMASSMNESPPHCEGTSRPVPRKSCVSTQAESISTLDDNTNEGDEDELREINAQRVSIMSSSSACLHENKLSACQSPLISRGSLVSPVTGKFDLEVIDWTSPLSANLDENPAALPESDLGEWISFPFTTLINNDIRALDAAKERREAINACCMRLIYNDSPETSNIKNKSPPPPSHLNPNAVPFKPVSPPSLCANSPVMQCNANYTAASPMSAPRCQSSPLILLHQQPFDMSHLQSLPPQVASSPINKGYVSYYPNPHLVLSGSPSCCEQTTCPPANSPSHSALEYSPLAPNVVNLCETYGSSSIANLPPLPHLYSPNSPNFGVSSPMMTASPSGASAPLAGTQSSTILEFMKYHQQQAPAHSVMMF